MRGNFSKGKALKGFRLVPQHSVDDIKENDNHNINAQHNDFQQSDILQSSIMHLKSKQNDLKK